jgi:hypothetical protein
LYAVEPVVHDVIDVHERLGEGDAAPGFQAPVQERDDPALPNVRSRTRAKHECHAVLARNLKRRPRLMAQGVSPAEQRSKIGHGLVQKWLAFRLAR